jgi:hypothetical protein
MDPERGYGKAGSGHIIRAIENLLEAFGADGIEQKGIVLKIPTQALSAELWTHSIRQVLDDAGSIP